MKQLFKNLTLSSITLILAAISLVISPLLSPYPNLETANAAGTSSPASSKPLPTVQIDGIVWAQVVVGNTVYATGDFDYARPAGVALGGAGTVARGNLLAYDITTGVLKTNFVHTLNGIGKAIAVSPDNTKLFVGGEFTTVDGISHPRIAAFNIADNTLISTFKGAVDNNQVAALTATNTTVYAGGSFTAVGNGAYQRGRLAAFNSTTGATLTTWTPSVSDKVWALLLTPDQSKVVIAGRFNTLNGTPYYGSGAVRTDNGASVPWGSQSTSYSVQNHGPKAGITSLSTDGSVIFLTAFAMTTLPGFMEGRAAVSAQNGALIWINDCHGDSYGSYATQGVLYSVGHAHDCAPAGGFPETNPMSWYRALAESTTATHLNGPATSGYTSFQGLPAARQLVWYPNLVPGSFTGTTQAAWSITGNSNYITLGGEFPVVDGVAQQGLVRFALNKSSTNNHAPNGYAKTGISQGQTDSNGVNKLILYPTWDSDDSDLTYRLYRDNISTPIFTKTIGSRFWIINPIQFNDTGLTPGKSYQYTWVATDPYGATATTYSLFNDTYSAISYSTAWTRVSGRANGEYRGDLTYTTTPGASATFTFTGTGAALIIESNYDRGNVLISIDGGPAVTVNTYTSKAVRQKEIYKKTGLTRGTHTMKVTHSTGQITAIDGFRVIP